MFMIRELKEKPHLIWLDNFAKLYYSSKPTIKHGSHQNCLWTGVATVQWDGWSNISLDVVSYPDGSEMSAMPLNMGTSYMNQHVKGLLRAADANGDFHLDNSIVRRYNVNNVPCKPVPDMIREPGLHALLTRSPDGLNHWYPNHLLETNIASNTGLFQILRDYVEEAEQSGKYLILLVDINIFNRICKV